jgi:serine/threonine-protein kinase
MARANDFGGVALCPGREELAAFERGQLPLERLEAIAEHLERCTQCESSLEQFQVEDTIQQHLRYPPSEGLWLDESLYLRLEDRARAIALEPGEPTVTDGGPRVREELRLPLSFGTHLLLEQLEPGGMGIVYKSRQESLKRVVALKVIKGAALASSEARARFCTEAETLARMRHANVVQIHEFGEYQGEPFFTMEWLDGGTLADRLDGRPQDEREAAQLLRTLARAVQALHDEGVVHRDLKPGNILFDADGTPKIVDFGLVKLVNDAGDATQTDAILGTPAYMAPEQARGSRDIGNTTDIYALGAILYEMLTGRPPLKGVTRDETMELVRTQEPEPPSRHRPKLDRVLEAICLKCLEKKPADRYSSAGALANDLDRWLKNEPTQVRPPSRAARVRRAVRRHPRTVAAACLAVLLVALASAAWYFLDPDRPVKSIESRLRRGETVTLIGDKGEPAWSRWTLRRGVVLPAAPGWESFTISAQDSCLLTLLPDPQGSYRFSAQVRHLDTSRTGWIGLCFAHSIHNTARGLNHCFCTLDFNDLEAPHPAPDGKTFHSMARLSVWRSQDGIIHAATDLGSIRFIPAAVARPGELLWRNLAVEVRPEGIKASWEGIEFADVPTTQILSKFELLKMQRDINEDAVNVFPDLYPAFSERDALGLHVDHGKASYRHVVVQPLP